MALQKGVGVQSVVQHQNVTMAALISNGYDYTRPRHKEIRQATVLDVKADRVFVDLGAKRDGLVPSKDLDLLSDEYRSGLQTGSQVPVYILDNSDVKFLVGQTCRFR